MGGRDAVDIQLSLEYNVKKTNIGGISMKLMIASDLHGSAHWCRKLLDAFDREGADRLLLLGDLLYHGPRNPLPEGYAPMEVAELLNARRGEIFWRGELILHLHHRILTLCLKILISHKLHGSVCPHRIS